MASIATPVRSTRNAGAELVLLSATARIKRSSPVATTSQLRLFTAPSVSYKYTCGSAFATESPSMFVAILAVTCASEDVIN